MAKIIKVIGKLGEKDKTFVSDKRSLKYLKMFKSEQEHIVSYSKKFPLTDGGLIRVLDKMLAFNPDLRSTAEQLVADPYFDDIREPSCEQPAPFKVTCPWDSLDCEVSYDYETDTVFNRS